MELIIIVTDIDGCAMTNGTFISLNHRIIYDGHNFHGIENLIQHMSNAYKFIKMIRTNKSGDIGRYTWKWECMTTSKSGTIIFGENE